MQRWLAAGRAIAVYSVGCFALIFLPKPQQYSLLGRERCFNADQAFLFEHHGNLGSGGFCWDKVKAVIFIEELIA